VVLFDFDNPDDIKKIVPISTHWTTEVEEGVSMFGKTVLEELQNVLLTEMKLMIDNKEFKETFLSELKEYMTKQKD